MSNCRPISILPIFSKVVEKLIHKRMTALITIHTILTPCQFGFIKNRSTESALLFQKEIILNSFEQESYMLGIFVDYSKAFNRINHRTLAEKLEHYGFRGQFLQLLNSYLNDRKQQVIINGSKSTFLSLWGVYNKEVFLDRYYLISMSMMSHILMKAVVLLCTLMISVFSFLRTQ